MALRTSLVSHMLGSFIFSYRTEIGKFFAKSLMSLMADVLHLLIIALFFESKIFSDIVYDSSEKMMVGPVSISHFIGFVCLHMVSANGASSTLPYGRKTFFGKWLKYPTPFPFDGEREKAIFKRG